MTDEPTIAVQEVAVHERRVRTRFPFEYGIARMTELPHCFVQAVVEVNGERAHGLSAEGLPPKWFTKNPDTRFEDDDLPQMRRVIDRAAQTAIEVGEREHFFAFWEALSGEQQRWAEQNKVPPLLATFGVSLLERAVLDALCRATGQPFATAVRRNALGLRLGAVHEVLQGTAPADLFPETPRSSMHARHTVGLGDPIVSGDTSPEETPDDGLPYALTEAIEQYGLTHFKIKVRGNLETDLRRLMCLAELLPEQTDGQFRFTLDGNEQFSDVETFREHWEMYRSEPALGAFFENHLLFVEQPLHRNHALRVEVGRALDQWEKSPPMVVDESDATLESLPRALSLGYDGTSYKSCKGIVKGLANAGLLAWRRRRNGQTALLSGEDLSTIGPVGLLQDLTVMATLGIDHVERNGHHYVRGLSAFPESVQRRVLNRHGDLYERHPDGFATVRIDDGTLRLDSLLDAPFGYAPDFDPAHLGDERTAIRA
jgi:hypothetical protein